MSSNRIESLLCEARPIDSSKCWTGCDKIGRIEGKAINHCAKTVLHHKNIIDLLCYTHSHILRHSRSRSHSLLPSRSPASPVDNITNFCASFRLSYANAIGFILGSVCILVPIFSPRYARFMGSCLIFIHSFNILCFYNFIYWHIFYCLRWLIKRA